MAMSIDLAKGLDRAYEEKSLKDILDASPAALAGVTESDAQQLQQMFGIKTVRDFGTNKYFALAGVLAALESKL